MIADTLDQLLKDAIIICAKDGFKGLFISDLHEGVGDKADDFSYNSTLARVVLTKYLEANYALFVLGDRKELWENDEEDVDSAYGWMNDFPMVEIRGNHNSLALLPEAYKLEFDNGENILLCHGHQGDFFNSTGYPLSRWIIRHIWRNLQVLGMSDPTSAQATKNPVKHLRIRSEYMAWSRSRNQRIICGHTHWLEKDNLYYNCGSWIRPDSLEGVVVKYTGGSLDIQTRHFLKEEYL
jgi:UDP-2,3-diacylglucosamine pyrophosphatase LpxH